MCIRDSNNAVIGVIIGHEKILELSGVGFRASLKGNILNLQLGFSHDCSYEIPQNLKISVEKQTIIKISGLDKQNNPSTLAFEVQTYIKSKRHTKSCRNSL